MIQTDNQNNTQQIAAMAAALAASELLAGQEMPAVALPNSCSIHTLEHLLANPLRQRGDYTCRLLSAFLTYCDAHTIPGTSIFVDPAEMAATAIFDLHDGPAPDWGTHKAHCNLEPTPAYNALRRQWTQKSNQQEFIDWCEDWRNHMVFFDNEGGRIEYPKAINAIRKLDLKKARNLTSEQGDLKASKSTFEQIEIQSEHGLPAGFTYTCEPYRNFELRKIDCRLRAATANDEIKLYYRIGGLDALTEEIAEELRDRIQEAPETKTARVFIGTYLQR